MNKEIKELYKLATKLKYTPLEEITIEELRDSIINLYNAKNNITFLIKMLEDILENKNEKEE